MADRPGWYATFHAADGKRVTRGLRTRDKGEADLICRALGLLAEIGPQRIEDAPPSMPPRALGLYFGVDVPTSPLHLVPPHPTGDIRARSRELDISEIGRIQAELELAGARERIVALEGQLAELRASMLGHAVEAGRRCPPIAEALERYEAHMRTASTSRHWIEMVASAKAFAGTLPPGVRTPAQITGEHAGRWLDVTATGAANPLVRRHRNRIRVGRWLNWCARTWGYASPMAAVAPTPAGQLAREVDEIHWHELAEVQAVLEALQSDYWRALVATLAFAGLRLAELIWLRRCDIETAGDGHQLVVTTVDDGHGERHRLKTSRSRRIVQVEPTLLWPVLERHLAALPEDAVFAFPMPRGITRRTRATGHPERWRVESLSRRLTEPEPPKDGKRRSKALPKSTPGVLPGTMSARSLRRTFGSLLLRSGRSVEEVAAAMGNTSDVVRRHYARILGSEVAVAFAVAPEA